jgi:Na+/H+ antiporter NhaD/arsenite permease-like protein
LKVPALAVVPFALLLVCIAALPLLAPRFWEKNRNKAIVATALSVPVAVWLLGARPQALWHSAVEYTSFIALLLALFVACGNIHVSGDLDATPRHNVTLLGAGAVLANAIGTTGASMLLIRLILRTNSQRRNVAHLPFFFILIVSNCGGLLTPLGDPPLFLGYLRGVPFTWTLKLWPVWIVAIGYLLAVFYLVDRRAYARERPADLERDRSQIEPVRLHGWRSVGLLIGVVLSVFLPTPFRELAMFALALVAYFAGGPGAREARKRNGFCFHPMLEVALLFAGIFVTMVPALALLEQHGRSLGLTQPWHYFLVTGALSSVLDNAPTYLTFLSAAQSLGLSPEVAGVPAAFLLAISAGAVLMGANTYIGNGPNFMVKAIADAAGYPTASFFRHALLAVIVLAPVYAFVAFWVS